VDIEMFDESGDLVTRITGLTLRPATRDAIRPTATTTGGRYRVQWIREASAPVRVAPDQARRCLIVSDSEATVRSAVEQLRQRGVACVIGVHAPAFSHRGPDEFLLDLDDAGDVRKMLTEVVAAPQRLDAVFYLSLAGDSTNAAVAPANAERDCSRLLTFVQGAAQFDIVNGPSLCVVTRGAQAVGDSDAIDPAQSALWGMATVISLEHSEWRSVLVDLDAHHWEADLGHVIDDVLSGAGTAPDHHEDRIAYRGGIRHVARLVPAAVVVAPDRISIRGDASYLITGGLGAIGLEIATWLADQGAGTIVLAGRRVDHAPAMPAVQALEQRGARIMIAPLDVANDEQVATLIARINTIAPLKGVVHAAGVLEDAILMRQRADQFARVLQPKTHGAWNLHVHTQALPLDFFVLCSSMASVTGSPGQANYAAANAFLDGLAWYRRERHLPALSINWGRWDGVGVAARVDGAASWQLEGFGVLTTAQALSHLDALLHSTQTQISISPIEVSRMADVYKRLPLFRALAPTGRQPEQRTFRDRLNAAPAARRRGMLDTFVRESVAAVLGVEARELTDRRAGFSSLGMDSLSTLDLRNRLQTGLRESLPAALAFHYPNLETLTGFLATGLIENFDTPVETTTPPAAPPLAAALSRSDLDTLLADRMASLKDTLKRSNHD
jgi:acyl carrier protein